MSGYRAITLHNNTSSSYLCSHVVKQKLPTRKIIFFHEKLSSIPFIVREKKKKKRTWIFSFFIASRKTSKHLFHLESGTKEEKRLERLNVSINNEASRRYIYIYINVYIYTYMCSRSITLDHVACTEIHLLLIGETVIHRVFRVTDIYWQGKGIHWNRLNVNVCASLC